VEHRWGQRRAVNTSARIVVDAGVTAAASLLDFSLSGGFIETELELVPLARLLLEIDLLEGRIARALRIDAYVVRQSGRGYGIEWHNLNPNNLPTAWAQHQLHGSPPQPLALAGRKPLAFPGARRI
jgi:hypothetical protein